MIPQRYRHRLGGLVAQRGLDFQHAIFEPIRHLHRVGERELRHQVRIFPEFQAAGDARRLCIRLELHHLPARGEGQQAMNRLLVAVAADVAEIRIQQIFPAVHPIGILVEAIGPRP